MCVQEQSKGKAKKKRYLRECERASQQRAFFVCFCFDFLSFPFRPPQLDTQPLPAQPHPPLPPHHLPPPAAAAAGPPPPPAPLPPPADGDDAVVVVSNSSAFHSSSCRLTRFWSACFFVCWCVWGWGVAVEGWWWTSPHTSHLYTRTYTRTSIESRAGRTSRCMLTGLGFCGSSCPA